MSLVVAILITVITLLLIAFLFICIGRGLSKRMNPGDD